MSVYISGLEMPKDDMKNIMILADGRVFQFSGYGNPKPLGTAVFVPEHGRLIDADALKEVLKPVDSIREYEPEWTWGELYRETCNIVDEMPTIIPADPPVMYYPQVDGITPSVIKPNKVEQT